MANDVMGKFRADILWQNLPPQALLNQYFSVDKPKEQKKPLNSHESEASGSSKDQFPFHKDSGEQMLITL